MMKASQIFKAAADETRLRILALLLENDELCVCDLMAALSLPQSTVSRHLAYLRYANLVRGDRRGVWMNYRIAECGGLEAAVLDAIRRHCSGLRQAMEDARRYADYLKEKKADACAE